MKVAERDAGRTPYAPGRDKLRELIAQRVEVEALFQPPDVLMDLIDFSGGHVGELLTLIRYALDYTDDVIREDQVGRAKRKMVNDKDRMVTGDNLPDLVDIYRRQEVDLSKHARLLKNLLALEYMNGGRWADVHPAVRMNPRFQAIIVPPPKAKRARASARKKK